MKNFYLIFLLCFTINISKAQIVPNYSFENWHDVTAWADPMPFNTFNQMSWNYFQQSGVIQSDHVHGGSSAAFLQLPPNAFGDPVSAVYLGTPGTTGFTETYPFNGRPDSFVFWTDYNIADGDFGTVVVTFYLGSSLIGSSQTNLTGSTSGYERHAAHIGWITDDMPDGIAFAALSTSPSMPNLESTMYIDDIELIYNDVQGDAFPGGDFELWNSISFHEPEEWSTSNPINFPQTAVTEESDGYVGECARIITRPVGLEPGGNYSYIILRDVFSEECGSGTMSLGNGSFPNQINGYYKYLLSKGGPDTATVYLGYEYYNNETGDCELPVEYYWSLVPTEEWTPFSFTLPEEANAFLCGMGDEYYLTIGFISTSINQDGKINPNAPEGSALYIDEITLGGEICVGVDEIDTPFISIFPNPARDFIQLQSPKLTILNYTIYNANGQEIASGQINQNNTQLNIQHLPQGIYSIRATLTDGRVSISRFVVE